MLFCSCLSLWASIYLCRCLNTWSFMWPLSEPENTHWHPHCLGGAASHALGIWGPSAAGPSHPDRQPLGVSCSALVQPAPSPCGVCPQPERGHCPAGEFRSEPRNTLPPRAVKCPGQRGYQQAVPQCLGHWIRPASFLWARTLPQRCSPAGLQRALTHPTQPRGPGSSICPLGSSPIGRMFPFYRWETEAQRKQQARPYRL